MSTYGALLGRLFSHGAELELASGIDFVGDLYARYNAATGRLEVWADVLPGATPGAIAVVSADGLQWEAGVPADVLRSGYDDTIADTSIAADAGQAWLELKRWPLASVASVTGKCNTITIEATVTDGPGPATAPRDRIVMRAVYTRRDSGSSTLENADEETVSTSATASVPWTIKLRAAEVADASHDLIETRIRLGSGGDLGQVILEARKHATATRSIKGRAYFGVED